ncbi:hypothetical protein LY90DRAFT_387718, partial [Neocallimastix californiae]
MITSSENNNNNNDINDNDNQINNTSDKKIPTLLSLAKIWLTEWTELEKKRRIGANLSRLYFTFAKALESVRNSKDEDIKTLKDLGKLKGIGNFILGKITKRLEEYQSKTGQIIIENLEVNISVNKPKNNNTNNNNNKPKRKVKKKKEYVPAFRSGSYAILVALYDYTSSSSKSDSMLEPFLTKAEIIRYGQPYCSSSFTVPVNGTHFTAWSSMKELIRRELVGKMGSPPKYFLTDEGVELAKRLVEVTDKLNPLNTSEVINEN